ncbi:MAG: HrpB1 family type III secretion system apparatus protein, partial [Janthinobacterium lividum]
SPGKAPYLECHQDVVGGLIETASCALLSHFPKAVGDTFDVELVVDALRVLRPAVTEISMLDGVLHLVHGRWDEASHTLRELLASAPGFSYARALLAYCQFYKGDEAWRQTAAEALEIAPTAETRALVQALQARDDLRNAMRDYRGGEFVVPDSCRSPEEAPAPSGGVSPRGGMPARTGTSQGFDMSSLGYLRA